MTSSVIHSLRRPRQNKHPICLLFVKGGEVSRKPSGIGARGFAPVPRARQPLPSLQGGIAADAIPV